jgi:NADH-quinone oxidoreductase subunit M
MLVALIYVYLQTDGVILEGGVSVSRTFHIQALYVAGSNLSAGEQSWIFWGLFIAFAIKMPVFPFHTWQPDTYAVAPTQGTMLLSGIMLKMGTYGLIRWLLPVVPAGVNEWGPVAITLSVISIVYASCLALVQKELKRLMAYSSMAHAGLISAGVLAFNMQGIQGALMQMLAHGVNVVGLFFVADIIFHRMKTTEMEKLGGLRNANHPFATLFLIILLGSIALPLTNGFVGEFLLITGIYKYGVWMAAFSGLTVILGAVYMLRAYRMTMLGESTEISGKFSALNRSEKVTLVIICAAVIAAGVFPKPLLDLAEPAVKMFLEKYAIIPIG